MPMIRVCLPGLLAVRVALYAFGLGLGFWSIWCFGVYLVDCVYFCCLRVGLLVCAFFVGGDIGLI